MGVICTFMSSTVRASLFFKSVLNFDTLLIFCLSSRQALYLPEPNKPYVQVYTA